MAQSQETPRAGPLTAEKKPHTTGRRRGLFFLAAYTRIFWRSLRLYVLTILPRLPIDKVQALLSPCQNSGGGHE